MILISYLPKQEKGDNGQANNPVSLNKLSAIKDSVAAFYED